MKQDGNNTGSNSTVVDAMINWQDKKYVKLKRYVPGEDDIRLYTVEAGQGVHLKDAEWYMRTLLTCVGINLEDIPGWESTMRISWGTHLPMPDGAEVPQGTLYLGVALDRHGKRLPPYPYAAVADVKNAMRSDAEAQECAGRLLRDRIYRVWLDVKDRQFTKAPPKYINSPMAKLQAKPKDVIKHQYHIPMGNMDLVIR